jgi:hypothetical protein
LQNEETENAAESATACSWLAKHDKIALELRGINIELSKLTHSQRTQGTVRNRRTGGGHLYTHCDENKYHLSPTGFAISSRMCADSPFHMMQAGGDLYFEIVAF